jgi:NADH dehydrogenase
MSGIRTRLEAFIDWTWTYFSRSRGPQVLDRSDAARINWQDDAEERPEPGKSSGHGLAVANGQKTTPRPSSRPKVL